MVSFEGVVVRGDGRGRELGFPTANVLAKSVGDLEQLSCGVYIVRVQVDGVRKKGVANIGKRPTFSENGEISIEVHIPGFLGDLYGQTLFIDLIKHLRDEVAFTSVNELKQQISADVEKALQYDFEKQNT